ncbi:8-oxo-dGTP diphosphatase [Alkalihalobacillus sp. AL-G]|uniref:NUDIX hydrolase n=1 Tax=Alkalihalobacillus sp. AL-G TaxID=2926399 RepID=UPI00272D8449|nr:8-oxo-dGTP diphosphatase [Alkalihalobacillus sp. AL-G]WLD92442.1 8-oxo-dGTP diphosphatase [Alkalihalobacillus sp. AL-G]
MLRFTICFIIKGSELLMLNRNKAPNKGLWNGVGGKINAGETPEQCIVREVAEETGLQIKKPRFTGTVQWENDNRLIGGMYVFVFHLDKDTTYPTPVKVDEGLLDWKSIDWLLEVDNAGVVSNIRFFLTDMLKDPEPSEYHCYYISGKLNGVRKMELSQM